MSRPLDQRLELVGRNARDVDHRAGFFRRRGREAALEAILVRPIQALAEGQESGQARDAAESGR
jgi:hypothetical protein